VLAINGFDRSKASSSVVGVSNAPDARSTRRGEATQDASPKPIFLAPGGGRIIQEVGDGPKGQLTFKLGGGEEGSTFEFAEGKTVPNGGPPVHIHLDTDEAFYVVSGTFRVKVGDQLKDVGPGSFVFAPRGVPHAYVNTGEAEGTLLIVASPTKWEAYMREITEALRRMPSGHLDQKVLNAISDKYKVRIVGPPLGAGPQLELPRNP
jgi:mannose-6-phosphate isomerase-like protein (cupin superfamily)